jgi:hypothetical protein
VKLICNTDAASPGDAIGSIYTKLATIGPSPHLARQRTKRRGRGRSGQRLRTCSGRQDSIDMSWLPLPRFESRAVCVAVSCLRARVEGATPNIR